jgi:hypothetical protein
MEALRRAIKADIATERPGQRARVKLGLIRHLMDEASFGEGAQKFRSVCHHALASARSD